MNVNPNLLTHAKFTRFKAALGEPNALEYLIALWGHCQRDKRGEEWGKVSAEYVETVCGWLGAPGKLFDALLRPYCGKAGWIEVRSGGRVRVTGWNEQNGPLIRNWNANPSGKSKGSPQGTRKGPLRVPEDTQRGTPLGLDLTVRDVSGEAAASPLTSPPDSGIPTLEQVLAYGRAQGIAARTCERFWKDRTRKKAWRHGRNLIDWQGMLRDWWAEDQKAAEKSGTHSVEKNREQLEALLDSERDPEKRRELAKKLEGVA